MEEDSVDVASTQKTLQSIHDAGWNDPPSWAFSGSRKPAVGTPIKRLLNKRVAFPLDSKVEQSSSSLNRAMPPVGNIPPPAESVGLTTAPHKPLLAPTGTKVEQSDVEINKDKTLKDTLDNLKLLIEQVNSAKAAEIQKRLERMETMWNEDKLHNIVHKNLWNISEALKDGDVEKADRLHISLMMNNASVCSSWIPGIRQLITEMKNKKL